MLAGLVLLTLAAAGCPAPPPNGNDTPNGFALTAEQVALIDSVFRQLRFAWAGLGALSGINEVQAYLVADEPLPADRTCPREGVSLGFELAIVDFEFDQDCPPGPHAAPVIAGQVVLVVGLKTGDWTGFYRFLTLDAREMNGSVQVNVTGDGLGGVGCTGTFTLSTMGIGTMTGDLTFELSPELLLTNTTGDWIGYDGTTVVAVTLTDVVLDLDEGSFIPAGGTVAFPIPGVDGSPEEVAVMTFTADSPNTGLVSVTVGAHGSVEHTLAGF